jgi:hypothetical protein
MSKELREIYEGLPSWKKEKLVPEIKELLRNNGKLNEYVGLSESSTDQLENLMQTDSVTDREVMSRHVIVILEQNELIDKDDARKARDWINKEFVIGRGRGLKRVTRDETELF